MSDTDAIQIVARAALPPDDYARATALAALCNAHDGLDLKLEIEPERPGEPAPEAPGQFLAYDGDELVGYCSAAGDGEAEVCGMVHPARRRQGIGGRLLDAALAECRRRGSSHVLLICEDASVPGRAFVATLAAPRAFSENRMELDVPAEPVRAGDFREADRLTITRASAADLDDIVAVQSAAFGDIPHEVRASVREGLDDGRARFYVARLGEAPVATMKVYTTPEGRAGIYAFGVPPQYRRRGFGRQFMRRVASELARDGYRRLWLEVDAANAPAIALYRSVGFRHTTTYGYYRLAL